MGRSNHVLMIHHHNILHSARGGKNFSRFVVPNGASVGAPAYVVKPGSRTEPSGRVFALADMDAPAWAAEEDAGKAAAG